MSEVLYNDSYCIGIEELNKIYLSLLTSADHIYINRNVEVDWQLPCPAYKHIKTSLDTLHKQGLIKYWSFPYEPNRNASDIVLDSNEYHIWDNIINRTFFDAENLQSIFHYLSEGASLFTSKEENTSKILLIRREYWTYALLAMLHADKVLNYFPDWMPDQHKIPQLVEKSLEDIVAKHIFSCSSSSVFALEPNDVISLHKKNKKLRNQLNQKSNNISTIQTDIILNSLLQEAVEANDILIKQEKWDAIDSSVDLSVTLAGIAVNLTPIGFIFNQIQTAKDIGQGIYNVLGALYGGNDTRNLFYILIKMKSRLNNKLKKVDVENIESLLLSNK